MKGAPSTLPKHTFEKGSTYKQRCVIQIQVGTHFHKLDLDIFVTTLLVMFELKPTAQLLTNTWGVTEATGARLCRCAAAVAQRAVVQGVVGDEEEMAYCSLRCLVPGAIKMLLVCWLSCTNPRLIGLLSSA
jgi:hypothetical protein